MVTTAQGRQLPSTHERKGCNTPTEQCSKGGEYLSDPNQQRPRRGGPGCRMLYCSSLGVLVGAMWQCICVARNAPLVAASQGPSGRSVCNTVVYYAGWEDDTVYFVIMFRSSSCPAFPSPRSLKYNEISQTSQKFDILCRPHKTHSQTV